VPKGVEVELKKGNEMTVKGPKGQLARSLDPAMSISIDEGVVTVSRPSD